MSAREAFLARVRGATSDVVTATGSRGEVPMIQQPATDRASSLDLFAENVADYRAQVVRTTADGIPAAVTAALAQAAVRSVMVPEGFPAAWLSSADVEQRRDTALAADELDQVGGVVTGATVGIATTGTIILSHGAAQGRRALTLVPDVHVCVVEAGQVVHDVPEAVARLAELGDATRPQTWISGPSATSDIELDRVEGVHGPRTLVMILVDD